MSKLIPALILAVFFPVASPAAWEDSPDCPGRMAVTRQATRDFYQLFASPGASTEEILESLARAKDSIGPSREVCVGPDEQESLDFQLLELRQIGEEIRRNRAKSSMELAPVATGDG